MWFLFAFIGVFSASTMSIGQQILKADTIPMIFWMRLTSVIFLSILLFFISVPTDPIFYIACALYGIFIVYLDIENFKYIAEGGASVATRLSTITSIPAFFLWVAIDHTTQNLYISHPVHAASILIVICMAAYFAGQLRKCTVTMTAIKRLWPVMLHGTIGTIFAKLVVLNQPDPFGGIIVYIMMICIVALIILPIFMMRHRRKFQPLIFARKNMRAGIMLAFCSMAMVISTYLAIQHIYNPTYVSVVMMSIPVIVSLYNRMTGHTDDSNKIAGFGLVACAMVIGLIRI